MISMINYRLTSRNGKKTLLSTEQNTIVYWLLLDFTFASL